MTTKTPTQLIEEMGKSVETMVKEHAERGTLTEAIRKEVGEMKESLAELQKAQDKRSLSLPGVENEKSKFDLHMAIKAARTGNWGEAGFEKEVIVETHKLAVKAGHPSDVLQKDVTAGTGANGGFLLPVTVDQAIIPLAIADRPVLNEMGITKLTNLAVGDFMMPKQTARATATWLGEEVALTKSGPTFNRNSLKMKKLGTYTICSNDMLRQGRGTIDGFIRADLGDAVALGLELALIAGTGSAYQPTGIVNQSGLTAYTGWNATRTSGGQFGVRDAAGQVNAIRKANLLKGKLGWVTAPDVLFGLKVQGSAQYSGQTTNAPLMANMINGRVLTDAEVDSMLGYKMRATTLVPFGPVKNSVATLTYAIFGDWSQVVLGMWGGTEIKVSDVASDGTTSAFTQDCFFVNIMQTADILLRDPAAMTVINDVITVVTEMAEA